MNSATLLIKQYGASTDKKSMVQWKRHDEHKDSPSGIPWWQDFNKLEMHVYNIRHTQRHLGQLVDRLRDDADLDVLWIGAK